MCPHVTFHFLKGVRSSTKWLCARLVRLFFVSGQLVRRTSFREMTISDDDESAVVLQKDGGGDEQLRLLRDVEKES